MYFPTDKKTVQYGIVFPLEGYLEKVVATHTHCAVLTEYAHSPRFRRHFRNKSSEVRSVPQIITTVLRSSELGKLIEDTLDGNDLETEYSDLQEEIISAAHKNFFRNGCSIQAPVHWYTTSAIQRCPRARVHLLRWITWASVSYRAMRV